MASYTRGSLKGVNMDFAKQLERELEEMKHKKLEENRNTRNPTIINNTDDKGISISKNEGKKVQIPELLTTNNAMEVKVQRKGKLPEKGKQSESENKNSVLLITIIAVIGGLLAVAVAAVMYFPPYSNKIEEVLYPSLRDSFLETMQNLKDKFPEIPDASIFMINYTILSTLDDNDPRSPATVLLLGTKGKKLYTDRVLQYLMDGLSTVFHEKIDEEKQFLDFEQVDKSSSDRLKLDISLKIDSAFENDKFKFLAMRNVDKAPWEVVSTLHPYFDHENAPFKRVVYLCTATTNDNMREEDLKEYRRLAENLFDIAWEKYHSDHRDAMYSRLFTSIAVF